MGYNNKSYLSQIINGTTPITESFKESLKALHPDIKRFWETGRIPIGDNCATSEETNSGSLVSEPKIVYETMGAMNKLLIEKDKRIVDKETIIKDKDEIIQLLKDKLKQQS